MISNCKSKKICITCSHYYPHKGGVETYVMRLSEELTKKGFKVFVLTHKLNSNDKNISESKNGPTIIRLDAWLAMQGRFPICKNNRRNKKTLNWLLQQNINYYVINTRFYKLSIITARIANSKDRIPVLIDHGSKHLTTGIPIIDIFVKIAEHQLTKKLRKYKINYYGISKKSVDWLKHFNIKAKGIIPNAIDADSFNSKSSKINIKKKLHIPKESYIVYFIGRYIKEKGIPNLLNATSKISNTDIHFIFTGEGPYQKKIQRYMKKYNNVHETGPLDSSDVAAIMKQSNVLCLPSRSEGFCLVLLEASSCKLPSIITNVGIADELISSRKLGYLLKNQDSNEIAKKILLSYKNKENNKLIGLNVYKKTKKMYSWSNATDILINACEKQDA